MEPSDAELARKAKAGDPDAFAELVKRYWNDLVRSARSILGDADAEDAVQDALVTAWRKIGRLRDPAAAGAWLRRISIRRCLAAARRRPSTVALGSVPEPAFNANPGDRVDVASILNALAPRQRAVMHLTVIEGCTDSEIAVALGIRPGSVRAHRRRARGRLEELFRGGSHEPLE